MYVNQTGPIIGQVNYLTFFGQSDDLACVSGNNLDEEYYVDENGRAIVEVIAPGGAQRALVTFEYTIRGTWSVGMALSEENVGFPTWPMTIMKAPFNEYSAMLRLEVPYGTVVKKIRPIYED